jgi:hypothetical protein
MPSRWVGFAIAAMDLAEPLEREAELTQLLALLTGAQSGRGHIFVVEAWPKYGVRKPGAVRAPDAKPTMKATDVHRIVAFLDKTRRVSCTTGSGMCTNPHQPCTEPPGHSPIAPQNPQQ